MDLFTFPDKSPFFRFPAFFGCDMIKKQTKTEGGESMLKNDWVRLGLTLAAATLLPSA